MLQKIRDRIQGWIAGVIIAVIAGAFMLFGVEYYLERGTDKGQVLATVDGTKITEQQFNRMYRQIERSQRAAQHGRPITPAIQKQLKVTALQQLINTTALVNGLTQFGFYVSIDQVRELVTQVPQLQVDGKFSPTRFQQLLYANQTTESQFLAQMRGNFLMNQAAFGIRSGVFVLPNEVNTAYRLVYQTRDFGYFLLPLARYEAGIKLSQKEIASFYKQHQDQYKAPEKVQLQYIVLSPKQLMKSDQITDAAARAYYNAHKTVNTKSFAAVKDQIKKTLKQQDVEQRLSAQSEKLSNLTYTNPDTLEVAAKALGLPIHTSPMLSKQGTKTGLFSNAALVNVAFSDEVLQDRNNSNPVTLKNGSIVVLRVLKHQPSTVRPLSAVQQEIRTRLLKNKAQAKAGLQAYSIQQALATGELPSKLARQHQVAWVQKRGLSRQSQAVSAPILSAVFTTPPAKKRKLGGVNSILLSNGNYVVIKVFAAHNAQAEKATSAIRQQLNKELSNLWGRLDYRFFANSVIGHAEIHHK